MGRFQRRAGEGLGGRPEPWFRERSRHRHGPPQEGGQPLRDDKAARIVGRCRGDEAQLQALGGATQGQPPRRHEQAQLGPDLLADGVVLRTVGSSLTGHQDDPRRTVRRQWVVAADLLPHLADGRVPCEFEGQDRSDPFRCDPLEFTGRLLAEEDQPTGGARLASWRWDRDPQCGRPRAGHVLGDSGRSTRQIRRGVDGDRIAPATLDDDSPPEERPDRRGQDIQTSPQEGQPSQSRFEIRGPAVQFGLSIDEEPDDAPLQADRIDPAQSQHGQAQFHGGRREGIERIRATFALDQQDGRHVRPGQGGGQLMGLGSARSHDLQGRGRDDGEITRFQGVERRHAGLEDTHPGDLAISALGIKGAWRSADRSCRREERAMEVAQCRHRRGGPVLGSDRASSGDELIEQTAELALDVDVAVRTPDDAQSAIRP